MKLTVLLIKQVYFGGIVRGLMYGGLAFAVGFSTVVAIGGDAKRKISGGGATFGGVIYTILLALINFALQSEYPKIKDVEIPTLTLANAIHPWIGLVLTVIMLTVMYNTILDYAIHSQHVLQNHIVKISHLYHYYDDCCIYFKLCRFCRLN